MRVANGGASVAVSSCFRSVQLRPPTAIVDQPPAGRQLLAAAAGAIEAVVVRMSP